MFRFMRRLREPSATELKWIMIGDAIQRDLEEKISEEVAAKRRERRAATAPMPDGSDGSGAPALAEDPFKQ